MAGTRLFYKLQFCDATDCTTNHFSKVLVIENNIVFSPFFLPHITEFNRITHLQYMDTLGIIRLVKLTIKPGEISMQWFYHR